MEHLPWRQSTSSTEAHCLLLSEQRKKRLWIYDPRWCRVVFWWAVGYAAISTNVILLHLLGVDIIQAQSVAFASALFAGGISYRTTGQSLLSFSGGVVNARRVRGDGAICRRTRLSTV